MDSTSRAEIAEEEMLLHDAIRSANRIVRLHLFIGTFNTCSAPTGMLEMTTGCLKSLFSDYSLHITV